MLAEKSRARDGAVPVQDDRDEDHLDGHESKALWYMFGNDEHPFPALIHDQR